MTSNPFGKQGWTPERLVDLTDKTYLITGANSGAGFEASKLLLAKGAQVVMLNRNPKKSEDAIKNLKQTFGNDAKVSFIQMDLASLDSISRASAEILATVSQIDALICNGAIAQVATQEFTEDGFESQLGVNYYGNFALVNLLFDKIEQSHGRVVFVSSEGHKLGIKTIQFDEMNWDNNYHANNVYSHSKLALMLFAYELQRRIKASGKMTKVYVCHPGASKTSLIKKDAPMTTRIAWSIMQRLPIVQSATEGAYPEVMCATEAELKQRAYYGPTGLMNMSGAVGECKASDVAFDETIAQKLWAVSEKATGCEWHL